MDGQKKAFVVPVNQEETTMQTAPSDLEFSNPKGGSRSKTLWGPQQAVHYNWYTEREMNEFREYFES